MLARRHEPQRSAIAAIPVQLQSIGQRWVVSLSRDGWGLRTKQAEEGPMAAAGDGARAVCHCLQTPRSTTGERARWGQIGNGC